MGTRPVIEPGVQDLPYRKPDRAQKLSYAAPTELNCTLVSYVAASELCCVLLSHASLSQNMHHFSEQNGILLSFDALF